MQVTKLLTKQYSCSFSAGGDFLQYDFSSRERVFGRILFLLTLNRRKMTERIIIAREDTARLRLETNTGKVYYDETRPLGSLLLHFHGDPTGEWNRNGMALCQSYGKAFPLDSERWKHAAPTAAYLQEQYGSGEPTAMFAAARTWDEYLDCFHLNHGADLLMERLARLYKPFAVYGECRPWQEETADMLSAATLEGDSTIELWYPAGKRALECVAASASLLPVVAYYLHRIQEWGYVFQQCKVCGKHFLARSRHYEVCSDTCRKVQAAEAKREFDARVKGDRLEQLHEAAYYYWYNRLRKLNRGKTADPEKEAAVKEAFAVFRMEAVRRKGMVKRREMSLAEFSGWLVEQQNVVDKMME